MKKKLLILFICFCTIGFAQDSTAVVKQDSTLELNQKLKSQLLAEADSVGLSDSIQQLLLQKQIDELRSSEKSQKLQLQRQLDSLNSAKLRREELVKNRIDSLRASTTGVPVVFNGDTLLLIYSKLGPISASERAVRVANRLEDIGDKSDYNAENLKVYVAEDSYDIMYDDIIIMSINDKDGFWVNKVSKDLAEENKELMLVAIKKYQDDTSIYKIIIRVLLIILVLVILFLMVKYLNKGFSSLVAKIAKSGDKYMKGIKIKAYEILSPARELQLITWVLNVVKWLVIILIVYIALPVVFSIFPSTKGVALMLFGYVTNPLLSMLKSVVGFIPELITIIVIIFATRYVVRFLKFLASEVETEKLIIPGFYTEWVKPTYTLLKVLIYAFAFIIIFPYLPGSDSSVFKGVSVFFGLLISLGSSSAIGNMIAGLVITYMRPFKIGDRVKIGEVVGDVIEKTMLVTRIRTIKNEDISIPNAAILSGSTINYSSSAKNLGLILHTTVTIGYDVPWKTVHQLLTNAAAKCEFVSKEPAPFVLQTSLDDFYVSYQINAYTQYADKAAKIYSDLYANIQDQFNEAGVEILSPHYRAQRDGNTMAVPPENLPADYMPPPFNVNIKKD